MVRPAVIGEELELMVRPEAVVLSHSIQEGQNVIKGVISEVIYLGECTMYHIRFSDGQVLSMKQQNLQDVQTFKPGDQIEVSWNIFDTRQI